MRNEIAIRYRGVPYDAMTTQDKKRVAIALDWIESNYHGDGLRGCLEELFNCLPTSAKYAISTQGKTDNSLRFSVNGKIRYIPAESKVNGGRIESLRKAGAPAYIIYSMDIVVKHPAGKKTSAWEEERKVKKVLRTADFLNALDSFGATKSTNGTHPEEAIQVTSKKLYQWLLSCPVDFVPGMTYTPEMF